MKGFWWKLPVLRGLSPLRRGFIETVAMISSATLVTVPGLLFLDPAIPRETFDAAAQIGATLLVAYAVETSWWLKSHRIRNSNRENWVGYTSGIGACAFLGVIVALGLSIGSGDLNGIQTLGLAWSALTLTVLGALVATLPLLIYEWTHLLQAEYPEE
jgi:uncharacterized membrane protein YfcA